MSNRGAGDERISYGGRWWMKDHEDFLYVFDEGTKRWDLWGGEPDDPLPPPQLLPEGAVVSPGLPQPSEAILRGLLLAFAISAGIHAILTLALVLTSPSTSEVFNPTQELPWILDVARDVYPLTGLLWQLALGALLGATALNINRYLHDRRAEED